MNLFSFFFWLLSRKFSFKSNVCNAKTHSRRGANLFHVALYNRALQVEEGDPLAPVELLDGREFRKVFGVRFALDGKRVGHVVQLWGVLQRRPHPRVVSPTRLLKNMFR